MPGELGPGVFYGLFQWKKSAGHVLCKIVREFYDFFFAMLCKMLMYFFFWLFDDHIQAIAYYYKS